MERFETGEVIVTPEADVFLTEQQVENLIYLHTHLAEGIYTHGVQVFRNECALQCGYSIENCYDVNGLWYFVTTTSDRKRTIIRLNG